MIDGKNPENKYEHRVRTNRIKMTECPGFMEQSQRPNYKGMI